MINESENIHQKNIISYLANFTRTTSHVSTANTKLKIRLQ